MNSPTSRAPFWQGSPFWHSGWLRLAAAASFVVGLSLAAPTAAELGDLPYRDCSEFFVAPEDGPVHLRNCSIAAAQGRVQIQESLGPGWSSSWIVWESPDADLEHTASRPGPGPWVRDVEAEVTNVDGRWFDDEAIVLEPVGPSAAARTSGFALMLPLALMLLAALTRGLADGKPTSF